ncbi:MAG: ComEC/Rec2 family competence protein, partial [Sarcina sp.]
MLIILEFSLLVKRNYSSLNGLALSAVLLLIFNPNYITDVGFYLSYFATLGILVFSKKFHRLLYFLPDCLGTSMSLSLAAQVFIYPIMIITFGEFSLNFILGSLILTPVIYVLLPIGFVSFIIFLFGISIVIVDKAVSVGFGFFNLIMEYLKYYAVESYYCDEVFAVIYVLILMFFYFIYKGYINIKYYKLSFSFMISLIFMTFNIFPVISIYNQKFSNAIIIEKGFEKVAYTNSESEYFLDNMKKECNVNKIEKVKKDTHIYLGDKSILLIKPEVDKSFIMLRDDNYGIIDLLNKDERIVFIKNRIYIDERGK